MTAMSGITVQTWGSALTIAAVLVVLGLALRFAVPRRRTRPVRLKVLARALLPARMVRSASGRADIGWFLFGILLSGTMLGWALWSSDWFSVQVHDALTGWFGAPAPAALPGWVASAAMTLALYLAYEFAYWLDHCLSHRVPALWAFHKVHHTAESLSPLTNHRVHPVDTIVFYNIVAVISGVTAALVSFGFGHAVNGAAIQGTNALIFLTTILFTHLQHTHLWISLPGRWGNMLMSPAHHQIHHSADVRHHDRNFGSSLALFDWLFGTLHRPTTRRERLRFGVDGLDYAPHGFTGSVLAPFSDAVAPVAGRIRWAPRSILETHPTSP